VLCLETGNQQLMADSPGLFWGSYRSAFPLNDY